MDEWILRSKELLNKIETKYKGGSNKFSTNKMMQYFLQLSEISDYYNEFSKLDLDEKEDNDDSSASDNEEEDSDESGTDDDDNETPGGTVVPLMIELSHN